MKEALQKAGVDTAQSRLAVAAYQALKGRSPSVAVDRFADAVLGDAEMLASLMGITRSSVTQTALIYLRDRANEMAGRASQVSAGSQPPADRRSASDPESHAVGASQGAADLGVATAERPVHVKEHGRSTPRIKQPAPGTKISKSAALSVATSGIFSRKIGYGERTLGTMTKFDFLQLERRGIAVSHIAKRFVTEVNWPDDQKTALQDCASKKLAEAIMASGHAVLDSLGITNRPTA